MLDSHVLIWAAEEALADDGADLIAERADIVFVSAASIWEIEIKRALGRLDAPTDLAERVIEAGYAPLDVTFEHAAAAGRLPLHHRDPFDRMLVAQARVEGLTLATADADAALYDVPLVSVARS